MWGNGTSPILSAGQKSQLSEPTVWGSFLGLKVVVGCRWRRYISSDYDGQALHPIDMYDAGTGTLLASLIDPNLETICPVNKPHPRLDAIVTGSSRSLYVWRPIFPGTGFPSKKPSESSQLAECSFCINPECGESGSFFCFCAMAGGLGVKDVELGPERR